MSQHTNQPAARAELTLGLVESVRPAVVLFLLLTGVTGIAYPLAVTVVAGTVFPRAATGSIIHDGDKRVGSDLIGQPFDNPRYFWGRPSSTTPAYNGMGGSGSNLATTNPALRTVVQERIERLRAADPSNTLPIPIDLVTASASGLDPHISPAAARYQAARIARERGLPIERVEALIYEQTVKPALGFLGQPTVHVLRLNRSLDAAKS
jgi:K+-transporting ATPase ATPase C chain